MSSRKAELILFSVVALFGFTLQAADAEIKKATGTKTSVQAKNVKSIKSNQPEYQTFTCPGLKENGYCSNRPDSEPKHNPPNWPRPHLSDHEDVEQFLNGNSDTLYGFDAELTYKKTLPSNLEP